jgi:Ca2+-transporting ATPase
MGERGTDVARESAALVLLDDDFSSIVQAVRLGRRIFDNLKKAIGYIVAVHVPIAGMALVPIVSRTQLVLLPEHIAFLELIIDPACSTVYEAQPEEGDVMRRPPRSLGSRLFGRRALATSLVQGLSVLAVVAFIFLFALRAGKGEEEARTLTFATLVIANLALIAANLSWSSGPAGALSSENRALWLVGAGAVASLLAVLYVPALREAFHFSVLHPDDLAAVVLAGLASVAWFWLLDVRTRIQRIRLG